eukprot:2780431-Pleurochrysis_carterae.AAC.2
MLSEEAATETVTETATEAAPAAPERAWEKYLRLAKEEDTEFMQWVYAEKAKEIYEKENPVRPTVTSSRYLLSGCFRLTVESCDRRKRWVSTSFGSEQPTRLTEGLTSTESSSDNAAQRNWVKPVVIISVIGGGKALKTRSAHAALAFLRTAICETV